MTDELKITLAQLQQVFDHVNQYERDEVCGFLVLDEERRVQRVVHGENVAEFTSALYRMDAESLLEAATAYLEGHPIVIYHSHPNSTPVPSVIDTSDAEQHPPDWRYLIVGRYEFALWRFDANDSFEQVGVEIL